MLLRQEGKRIDSSVVVQKLGLAIIRDLYDFYVV